MTADAQTQLLLIDGSGFIYRAFYALPAMTRDDGAQVGAVYGFINILMKLLKSHRGKRVAVVFDAAKKNFRHDIYPQYKATRRETPTELLAQIPLIKQAVEAFDLTSVELEGFEADDLIASYARAAADRNTGVTVVSGDKDLMQLVALPHVAFFDPLKGRDIGVEEVREKWGVGPDRLLDVLALAGDASDNVPGVAGIGPKTAAALIDEYGTLENLLDRADEIKQEKRRETLIAQADLARMSKRLITLVDDAPLPVPPDAVSVLDPSRDRVAAFLEAQRFKSILSKLDVWFEKATGPRPKVVVIDVAAPEYETVTSPERLEAILKKAEEQGIVAIDTETDGLESTTARIVGVSLAIVQGKAFYVPLRHRVSLLDLEKQMPVTAAMPRFKALLENESIMKVGHNIKFDLHMFANDIDFAPASFADTMVMAYALDSVENGLSLDNLAKIFLGVEMIPYESVCGKGAKKITFDRVDIPAATRYSAEDADMTMRLYRLFKPRLLAERRQSLYENFDRPLIEILWRMERAGVAVDAAKLVEIGRDLAARIDGVTREIHALAGETFNINSPQQIADILYGKQALATQGKTSKNGKFSTDAEALTALAESGSELAAKILDYRQITKLKSTYVDSLSAARDASGRVHTSFWQTGTSTGRLSSSDPNLQNIPVRTEEGRKIRGIFVAPGPSRVLIGADYSQVELRVMAHVADVKLMKEAFMAGADIHAATASQVFQTPLDMVTKDQRRRAKAINFGIIYGMSAFGLARQLDIGHREAQGFIDAYFAKYPEIPAFMERTKTFAHEHGYVLTPFKRKCHIQGIGDANPNRRGGAERAAINAPIQGGAADIMRMAMLKADSAILRKELRARMLLQVHDELLFEAGREDAESAAAFIKRLMETTVALSPPLVADVKIGGNWDEIH